MPPKRAKNNLLPSVEYQIDFHSHFPVDDRHNQNIIRRIAGILVPRDEILESIKVVRVTDGSFEVVSEFEAVDPARFRSPFVQADRPVKPDRRDFFDSGWHS